MTGQLSVSCLFKFPQGVDTLLMYIFVLSRVRSKYIIPKPGRDAEALVVGFEVVRHVMSAQFHEILALEAEMMQGVVGHVVDHIPKHKTGKNSIHVVWQLK